jgi:protein-L-isoaspartate(D-aspartate) O-methyltransferase
MVTEQIIPAGVRDQRVIEAMGRVPRHLFVSPGMEPQAYFDRPLPIGDGQTISQPLMVALMTESLHLEGGERVLEIGTGSGYQAAVLAELAGEVYSIERMEGLSMRARKALYQAGYRNVSLKVGDGTIGWPEKGPFDGIVVTAGAPKLPEKLKEQLADGGRLVVPVGGAELQQLIIVERQGNNFNTTIGTGCRFVKLIGQNGWSNGYE